MRISMHVYPGVARWRWGYWNGVGVIVLSHGLAFRWRLFVPLRGLDWGCFCFGVFVVCGAGWYCHALPCYVSEVCVGL